MDKFQVAKVYIKHFMNCSYVNKNTICKINENFGKLKKFFGLLQHCNKMVRVMGER